MLFLRKRVILYVLLILIPTLSNGESILTTHYNVDKLITILRRNAFTDIPSLKSHYWTDSIPNNMRMSYIRLGEDYLKQSWKNMPDSVFAQYKTIGNRSNYENLFFANRMHFTAITLAEIIEQKGRFIKDIEKGIHFYSEMIWWGLPAHYPLDHPEKTIQVVDLYNSEIACMLAWCCYMLRDEFPNNLVSEINSEINRRFLVPARIRGILSWKNKSSLTSNWNTWICENWLSCVLLSNNTLKSKSKDIFDIMKCLDYFIDGYSSDGYCDEGPGYWSRSVGSLITCLILLKEATNGSIDIGNNPKLRKMVEYISNIYIGNGYYVNFGDSSPKNRSNINVIFPAAVYLQDKQLGQFSAYEAVTNKYYEDPAYYFSHDGNAALGRELRLLSDLKEFKRTKTSLKTFTDYYYSNSQIYISRKCEPLYIAAKAGNNNEHHNHNDVGNYIIFADGKPLVIDLGVQTYTNNSFGKERYNLISTRSSLHNVPYINGQEQKAGAQYKADNIFYNDSKNFTTFAFDINNAYPKESYTSSWTRVFDIKRKKIVIKDDYSLKKRNGDTWISIVTPIEPIKKNSKSIVFYSGKDAYELSINENEVTTTIHRITLEDKSLQNNWGKELYQIRLSIPPKKKKGTVICIYSKF